ncbi:MAG: PRC-barrel domain-containing protein [Actinomycetota bacterium]|nr:PRC-barrel domain-containing protein [Actinomycetota bacterium]
MLFRLVREDPPRVRDFHSGLMNGRPLVRRDDIGLLHQGLSMFDTPGGALSRALGRAFVAAVELEEGFGFTVAKTFCQGHYTIWGDPERLARAARVVESVSGLPSRRGFTEDPSSERAGAYEIVEIENGDVLATFSDRTDAAGALMRYVEAHGFGDYDVARRVALVEVDEAGSGRGSFFTYEDVVTEATKAVEARDEATSVGGARERSISPDEVKRLTEDLLVAVGGTPVYSSDGNRIGRIEEIFVGQDTGEPKWIGLRAGFFGRKRVVVPATGAKMLEDRVAVPYTKDQVKDAPGIDSDEISQETEERLYAHYGLGYSERRLRPALSTSPVETVGDERIRERTVTRDAGGD